MQKRLVIFDFDSTLGKLDIPWDEVKKEALALAEVYDIHIDKNLHMMDISNILSEYPDTRDAIHMMFIRYESRCVESKAFELYPEMLKLVKELKAKGYSLAIASANCTLTIKNALSDAATLFDVIYGRDSVEKNKPNPEQLLKILTQLNISKEEAIFIGDSVYDESAALAAGVDFFNVKEIQKLREMFL
ncbi:HAD family hydrolase [Candidatus Micrarchaeota archaeon]|nr:HAD family hydrolase [Candidatus Micrarchaeota archaeon]